MQSIIQALVLLGLSIFIAPNTPITPTTTTENPCNIMYPRPGDERWGDGLYYLPNNAEIAIYKGKTKQKFGKLVKKKNYFKFYDASNSRRVIQNGDLEYIGHSSMSFIKVKGSTSSNYIQIFWHTMEDGLYIKKTDIAKVKGHFYTYKELLYNKNISIDIEEYRNWASIGVNLNRNCLNLRKGPSTGNAVIKCISGNREVGGEFSHFSLLESKGKWAKVEVVTYVLPSDAKSECDYSEHSKQVGWIKAMDDNGFPNIWYSLMDY